MAIISKYALYNELFQLKIHYISEYSATEFNLSAHIHIWWIGFEQNDS